MDDDVVRLELENDRGRRQPDGGEHFGGHAQCKTAPFGVLEMDRPLRPAGLGRLGGFGGRRIGVGRLDVVPEGFLLRSHARGEQPAALDSEQPADSEHARGLDRRAHRRVSRLVARDALDRRAHSGSYVRCTRAVRLRSRSSGLLNRFGSEHVRLAGAARCRMVRAHHVKLDPPGTSELVT